MRLVNATLVLLGLLLVSGEGLAWGPFTNRYICHEAVKFVWGVDVVAKCLPQTDQTALGVFCDSVYSIMGPQYEGACRKAVNDRVEIDPATVSDEIFNDTGNHYDFSRCPINKGTNRQWICGDGGSPAHDMYSRWVEEAKSAQDMCGRIYDFCVAATYFADSQSSLHNVKYVSNGCVQNIEESIDRCMQNGGGDCSSSQLCKFSTRTTSNIDFSSLKESSGPINDMGLLDYQQKLGESSPTVNQIIANLTVAGNELKNLPYKPRKGVVLLGNSIDMGGASGLLQYLSEKGVNVLTANASSFDSLKYNVRIIILGGHNSPEGVGKVASQVLSQEDESSLMAPATGQVFVKDGPWTEAQKVVIIAGNEAADTRKAWEANLEKVLDEVKAK
jgi:hypothetical protein